MRIRILPVILIVTFLFCLVPLHVLPVTAQQNGENEQADNTAGRDLKESVSAISTLLKIMDSLDTVHYTGSYVPYFGFRNTPPVSGNPGPTANWPA